MVLMAMLVGFIGYTMVYAVVVDQNWKFWTEWVGHTPAATGSATSTTTPSTTPATTPGTAGAILDALGSAAEFA